MEMGESRHRLQVRRIAEPVRRRISITQHSRFASTHQAVSQPSETLHRGATNLEISCPASLSPPNPLYFPDPPTKPETPFVAISSHVDRFVVFDVAMDGAVCGSGGDGAGVG